jgi:phosphate:Na+ symporter
MSINFDLWKLLAGLGIFLFGMQLIEESVKSLSGRAFRRIIRMYTNGRLRSIGSGALVTALLQSSSAVSLMVLAFVGAGVMNMQNAIGVIMGSNIGTTLTAWIISTIGFKIKLKPTERIYLPCTVSWTGTKPPTNSPSANFLPHPSWTARTVS